MASDKSQYANENINEKYLSIVTTLCSVADRNTVTLA